MSEFGDYMNYEMKKGSFLNPGAFQRRKGIELTVVARREGSLSVIFYDKNTRKKLKEIAIPKSFSVGRVYSVFFPEKVDRISQLL